jgi:hypothetical protein
VSPRPSEHELEVFENMAFQEFYLGVKHCIPLNGKLMEAAIMRGESYIIIICVREAIIVMLILVKCGREILTRGGNKKCTRNMLAETT